MRDDSDRAAMIYQHEARGTDKTITNAIDTHVQAEQARRGDDEDSPSGVLVPCWLMAASGPDGIYRARSGHASG